MPLEHHSYKEQYSYLFQMEGVGCDSPLLAAGGLPQGLLFSGETSLNIWRLGQHLPSLNSHTDCCWCSALYQSTPNKKGISMPAVKFVHFCLQPFLPVPQCCCPAPHPVILSWFFTLTSLSFVHWRIPEQYIFPLESMQGKCWPQNRKVHSGCCLTLFHTKSFSSNALLFLYGYILGNPLLTSQFTAQESGRGLEAELSLGPKPAPTFQCVDIVESSCKSGGAMWSRAGV